MQCSRVQLYCVVEYNRVWCLVLRCILFSSILVFCLVFCCCIVYYCWARLGWVGLLSIVLVSLTVVIKRLDNDSFYLSVAVEVPSLHK